MKSKITITIEKKDGNLDITYKRKDIVAPDNKDDMVLLAYIGGMIRKTIDNGFAPAPELQEEEQGKEDTNGKEI